MTEAASHRAPRAVASGADAARFARSLPTVLDGLIGRDVLLPAAVDLIGRSRLVTMAGTAGVGKTRFAIAAAAAAESEHGRPVLFVPMAPIADPVGRRRDGCGDVRCCPVNPAQRRELDWS